MLDHPIQKRIMHPRSIYILVFLHFITLDYVMNCSAL